MRLLHRFRQIFSSVVDQALGERPVSFGSKVSEVGLAGIASKLVQATGLIDSPILFRNQIAIIQELGVVVSRDKAHVAMHTVYIGFRIWVWLQRTKRTEVEDHIDFKIEQLLINLVRNAVESALTCAEEQPEPASAAIQGEPTPNMTVIRSEASESVAPAFGRNKQPERESNGPEPSTGTSAGDALLSEVRREAGNVSEGNVILSGGRPRERAYGVEGPSVTLRATEDADLVAIAIEDNGPGLANPENLFVPLYTTKKAGSGVGLALARQIVEAHGGSIELRNKPNHTGCIAEVRIPVAERIGA